MSKILPFEAFEGDVKTGNRKHTKRTLILTLAVLLIISCGFFSNQAEPVPTATVVVVPSETPTPPPTPTPTSVPPAISASGTVPCYSGPGDVYDLVIELQTGENAEIVGKSNGFWIVKTASGIECWVADQEVVVVGEVAAVPEVEPPPLPTPAAPIAPINLQTLASNCTVNKLPNQPTSYTNQFHLAWQDMSNNEDGFRVYRDGDLIAELPADRTDLVDELTAKNNRAHIYYVTAYNAVGETKSEAIALTCEGAGSGSGGSGFGGGGGGFGP